MCLGEMGETGPGQDQGSFVVENLRVKRGYRSTGLTKKRQGSPNLETVEAGLKRILAHPVVDDVHSTAREDFANPGGNILVVVSDDVCRTCLACGSFLRFGGYGA